MARQGIYVDGKKIIARYVGNKKVWERELEKLYITWTYVKRWSLSNNVINDYTAELDALFETSTPVGTTIKQEITRISIGDRSWKAKTFAITVEDGSGTKQRIIARISFNNFTDVYSFVRFTTLQSEGEIKMYKENV